MPLLRFNHYLLGKILASHFHANYFSSVALSLFSATNSVFSASYSTANLRDQTESKCSNFRNINDDLGKVGPGFQESLCFSASVSDGAEEEEGEEGEGSSDDDESLEFITSFHGKNDKQTQSIARVEIGDSEFRHPVVREVCRLITLSSAWNPNFEGRLRHLLRSLKPSLVCAVLRSQADERVALNFFYCIIILLSFVSFSYHVSFHVHA